MSKIEYVAKEFTPEHQSVIDNANAIITIYQAKGYKLTLRQLYYQFVARALLPNTDQNYKRLGGIINDGRLAGEIDWNAIEDRTRNLQTLSSWDSPGDIIEAVAEQFRLDLWESQPDRLEVWVEKEALAGIFQRICNELRVPYIACRGYMSQSEMWATAMRFRDYIDNGQTPRIFHFGDHDPSGIDMSRDIKDRLAVFGIDMDGGEADFERLALNMNQVKQYNPPPNPAKLTDSRCSGYLTKFGNKSWELDALDPDVLADLVRDAVAQCLDQKAWDKALKAEDEHKRKLGVVSAKWDKLTAKL